MLTGSTSTFGALLRRYRLAAGLTQETLAERAGLSIYGVQKLETGTTHPYRDTAARLTAALTLTAEQAAQLQATVAPVRRRGTPMPGATSDDRPQNYLPIGLTSFVGREHELASLSARLRTERLLTLVGAGGSGKTRLAIELGHQISEHYRDGVRLVELAQVTDPAVVPHRVAAVLAVQELAADGPLERALAKALRSSHLLLVLDNCEHLLDACAALVDLLLRECAALHVLATSREPIGIPGEITWSVAPLAVPDLHITASVANIERFPAVRLFVDRASAAQPSFALAAENADAVAQICRRLDGMPLALELAAARIGALTPGELALRLDQRFSLLTGGNRAALPRQQTLGATIDWSYLLLSNTQRRVFERLAVFAGGWTLDAAEAVCGGDGVAAEEVVDSLLQLVQKHLVMRIEARQGMAHYALLETLRQYAWDKLLERDPELFAARERHATYYSTLAERLDAASATTLLPFSGQTLTAPVFDILDDAHDNVQLALKWWLDTRRATEGLVLIRALVPLWHWRAVPPGGLRWVEATLDLAAETSGVPPALHAQALMFGGMLAQMQAGAARARAYLGASVAAWRALGDPVGLAMSLARLGLDHVACGELDEADEALREALALARQGGEAFTECAVFLTRCVLSALQGRYEDAAADARELLAAAGAVERVSYRTYSVTIGLVLLGRAESKLGASTRAMSLFREALTTMRDSGMTGLWLGNCLDWLAAELTIAGDPLGAARMFGAADAHWRTVGIVRSFPMRDAEHQQEVRRLQAEVGEDAFLRARDEGRGMDLARVFAVALDMNG